MNLVRAAAILACATPIYAQYGGPAILVRGQAPSAMTASQIDFQPFFSIYGTYSSGLAGVSVDQNGKPVHDSSYGVSAAAGVSGTHRWKHTNLGLHYTISATHNPQASYYDGVTQDLSLGITHMLSRHASLAWNTSAGLTTQASTVQTLLTTIPFDPSTLYTPTNDFYDNRTIYASSMLSLSIQKSTRLSYSVGATGMLTRRRSTALYGLSGGGARGDVQYRASRRSTVGVAYNYTHYAFRGVFSSTDIHGIFGTYALTLTRATEFSAFGGVAYYETKFVQTVPVDPAVAALIGISSAQRVAYTAAKTGSFSARISRAVQKGVFFASGGRGISPGNGLFLTSTSDYVTAGYSYNGLRHWAMATSASYNRSYSLGNVLGAYSDYAFNYNVSREILPHTHGVISINANRAASPDFKNYNRWQYFASLGLSFTPAGVTVRFW